MRAVKSDGLEHNTQVVDGIIRVDVDVGVANFANRTFFWKVVIHWN